MAVHHVSINVDDVDAALRFYTEALGLVQRTDRPDFSFDGAWLDAGAQQLHLIEGPAPAGSDQQSGRGQHFALLVADVDGAVAELRERGIEVTDARPVGSGRQAFVTDPSGNVVELHQTKA